MKKCIHSKWIIFSLLTINILAITLSCRKKNNDELENNVIAVKFNVKDFETFTQPINDRLAVRKISALEGGTNAQEEVLFSWNFDNSSTVADIAFNADPLIDYNSGKTDYSFVAGWPATGKCLSIRGAQNVIIKVKTANINAFSKIKMDVNSSTTGSRALFLEYSVNSGTNFTRFTDTLKYPVALLTSGAAKFEIDQSLANISLTGRQDLWIRIVLLEGIRPANSTYNQATGTFKIDNLQLSGNVSEGIGDYKYYYHIYDALTQKLVNKGSLNAQQNFEVELLAGKYYISLLTKNSNRPPIFKEEEDENNFSIHNLFTEKDAEIYAVKDTFELTLPLERSLTLSRIYSEVKVEFTDPADLNNIDSILIKQLHNEFYYYPFSANSNNNVDPTVLKIIPGFTATNKTITFNQFMGFVPNNSTITYQLQAFTNGSLLRSFELTSTIKNNIQILFRGRLLTGFNSTQGFNIIKNEQWSGKSDIDF